MILLGMVASTVLIFGIALFLTNKVQEKLSQSYNELAQLLTKTIAIESVELIKNIDEPKKYDALAYHTDLILETNDSISFIEFKNDKGQIIFSSKDTQDSKATQTKSSVSAPMSIKTDNGIKNILNASFSIQNFWNEHGNEIKDIMLTVLKAFILK